LTWRLSTSPRNKRHTREDNRQKERRQKRQPRASSSMRCSCLPLSSHGLTTLSIRESASIVIHNAKRRIFFIPSLESSQSQFICLRNQQYK
jgi:hypothetical protein